MLTAMLQSVKERQQGRAIFEIKNDVEKDAERDTENKTNSPVKAIRNFEKRIRSPLKIRSFWSSALCSVFRIELSNLLSFLNS